jgi:hypothetical protein
MTHCSAIAGAPASPNTRYICQVNFYVQINEALNIMG